MAALDWKNLLRTVAPAIASAIGTPAAGVAVAALSNAIFGRPDASEEDLSTVIAGGNLTGEQVAAIKKAEQDFLVEMARIEADSEKARLADVQNARQRQIETKDTMPQQIFYLLMAVYIVQYGLLFSGFLPDNEFARALITRGFGTIEIGLTGAIGYFIGSSKGSKQSGDSIRKIAEQSTK